MNTQLLYCTAHRFHIVFSPLHENDKKIEKGKTRGNLLFVCQDNLNNLWLLLHHFQK